MPDFTQTADTLAKDLLGCILVHQSPKGLTSGRIVETEAYLGVQDAAAHSFRGITPRTEVMFGAGGHAYIYFTYGMHYCFNVVAGPADVGEGVLIRALEPLEGIDLMVERRGVNDLRQLCSGPAKLVQAMGISKEHNGHDLTMPPLRVIDGKRVAAKEMVTTTRIGINQAKEALLRYYIKDSKFVSKK